MSETQGRLLSIYIAPDAGEPMRKLDEVRALEGKGLEGDRYAEGKGIFQKPGSRPAIRQISLIAREAIQAANAEFGLDFHEAETRRNGVTEGVDLNALVGREFKIGEVRLRGEELCAPCSRPSKLVDKEGFLKAFENRGGLRASILNTGVIREGDAITVKV